MATLSRSPGHRRQIEELHDVVVQLIGHYDYLTKTQTGCPWCATKTPEELLGWLRSEIAETAHEIDAVRANIAASKHDGEDGANPPSPSKTGGARRATPVRSRSRGPEVVTPTAAAMLRLESEVGDLLFDVFLMAAMCSRDGLGITIPSAAAAAAEKIRRRCPYIFGEETAKDAAEAEAIWQRVKHEEKAQKAAREGEEKALKAAREGDGASAGDDRAAVEAAAPGDAVVLFAKFPMRGKSKTRLARSAVCGGEEGAFTLATAMVEDALLGVSRAPELAKARKVILFAPADARPKFVALLGGLGVPPGTFDLVPMQPSATAQLTLDAGGGEDTGGTSKAHEQLTSSNLGDKLRVGLQDVLALPPSATATAVRGAIAIFGMDSPELSAATVAAALTSVRRTASAYICPAADGGYTLLALPPAAPLKKCFAGVEWSTERTCVSQLGALGRVGLPTLVGPTLHDIDEAADVLALYERLKAASSEREGSPLASPCPRTTAVLAELLGQSDGYSGPSGDSAIERAPPSPTPDTTQRPPPRGMRSTGGVGSALSVQHAVLNFQWARFGAVMTLAVTAVSSLVGIRRSALGGARF